MSIWILSPQQRRVLQLVACGFTYEQIGAAMRLSNSAVRSSLNQVYKRLNARCKIDAVFEGIRLGEISELHAYCYVEARQIANCLTDSKLPDIQLPHLNHDFLITSNNKTPVHYSCNPPFLIK